MISLKDDQINTLLELGLTREEIDILLMEPDIKKENISVPEPKPRVKVVPLEGDELSNLLNIITSTLEKGQEFQNKDLFPTVEERMGLTNRQTPSRLKKLAAAGEIVEVGSHSPKRYMF